MKLTIGRQRREADQREMIALSCKTTLSRINNNPNQVIQLIEELCKTQTVVYSHQFGTVCAHIALQSKSESTANQLINKFSLIFLARQYLNPSEHPSFETFDDLVSYGMKCLVYGISTEMVDIISSKKTNKERLRAISSKLLKSMLLEYIPVEYSAAIIAIYLQEKVKTEESEWAREYQNSFQELHPYQDLFLLLHSLSKFLVVSKNPVNLGHFFAMLEQPMMGVVEWPIVIGGRDMFDLPPIYEYADD